MMAVHVPAVAAGAAPADADGGRDPPTSVIVTASTWRSSRTCLVGRELPLDDAVAAPVGLP
jgi:hypothetical protein